MILERILDLVDYGLATGLIEAADESFAINRLLELFRLDELEDAAYAAYAARSRMTREEAYAALEGILKDMLDYAYENGLLPENGVVYRDLLDTKIMGQLVPRPSEVIGKFMALYEKIPDSEGSQVDCGNGVRHA